MGPLPKTFEISRNKESFIIINGPLPQPHTLLLPLKLICSVPYIYYDKCQMSYGGGPLRVFALGPEGVSVRPCVILLQVVY